MIRVLMCEGASEVTLMNGLSAFGHLRLEGFFSDRPIRARQLTKLLPLLSTIPIDDDIEFLRIGDTQRDPLSLEGLELREPHIRVKRYCTRPEIEILIIINEGLWHEYVKVKSREMPKHFLKSRYPNLVSDDYFASHDMADAIRKYKSLQSHRKDELYLADLLD